MKVLYACTELYPLLKTGGLADVGAALPAALQKLGCDVRLILPAFPAIVKGVQVDGPPVRLPMEGAPEVLKSSASEPTLLPGYVIASGQRVYLLDAPTLFQREGGPYQDASGKDWPDNAARFASLCWAAAGLGLGCDTIWSPDIVHAHDWHTGLIPVYLQCMAQGRQRPACVFTVHNLAYQGLFPADVLSALGLPESLYRWDGIEFHGQLSFMKAGLQFADAISTVSPRYAREIMTLEQGCGLEGVLQYRANDVLGILNGVDYAIWDPANDPLIDAPYEQNNLAGKLETKRQLQRALGLEARPDALLFAAVSRLSEQKGLHLIAGVLDELVARGGQLIVLGSGDAAIEASLRSGIERHPTQAVLQVGYDEVLAHRIMAAADVVMVPSRFEPCGLTQLYALRYGALPLVRGVGGLADTVTDSTPQALTDGVASGFVFQEFSSEALSVAMQRAFALKQRAQDWTRVQRHAMQLRFDWQDAARSYQTLYKKLSKQLSKKVSSHVSSTTVPL